MSSAGAALTVRALGLGKCRPFGAHCPTATINPTNTIQSQSNTKTQTQQFIYTPKNILRTQYHDTTPQTPNPTKSPERVTLLQSPGWNEGKARNETLGKQKTTISWAPTRSGTNSVGICLTSWKCRPWRGSKYVLTHRTQGLRPGLCRSIAPLGLFNNNSNKMNTTYSFQ